MIKSQVLLCDAKRFFGPILCLAATYATIVCLRFTAALVATWGWGITAPASVSYVAGALLVTSIGLTPTFICGYGAWVGSQWSRARL